MANDERDPKKDRTPVDLRDLAEDELVEHPGKTSERAQRARTSSVDMKDREVPLPSKAGGLGHVFGQPLDPVTYELRVRGGPDPGWHVRRMHFVEAISEPYELVVDVLTDDIDLETDDLLGADAELEYTRNTFARVVPGIIERVDFLGVASDRLQVRLHIVPAFKLLQLQVDTRIFQDKSVPEILQEVLEPSLRQYGRTLDRSKLGTGYLVRDYCVQYGESDFAFASRLMEEEGIAYIFEPEAEGDDESVERLVLLDQTEGKPNSDFPEIDGDTLDQIPIITDRPETADCESLRYLEWHRPEQVTKLTTRRFNWKRPDPQAPPSSEQKRVDARGRMREVYAPDGRRRIEDYQKRDGYRGTKAGYDEDPLTVKRFQGLTGGQARGHGASNVTCLRAGALFEIAEHPHGGVSFTRMLVTRAVHSGECPDQEMGAEAVGARFSNTFECVPATTPFRQQERTSKPRVFGPQTATVTGPEGEEIHTDVHGRIKVLFHWDRLSPLDDSCSCWVRVAQMWAGSGWGTWFLPRIGMEVVVEFLDGNPDRPLVVGCVYNGRNGTPYPLPEEKTKSTIKSNSSIGGEGFNEIRFEDAKGAEEIFIHAQRDQNEEVRRNRSRLVDGNEWLTIQGNKSVRIHGHPAHGDSDGLIRGRETWIDGHEKLQTTETVHVVAPKRLVLEVSGSSIVIEPGAITIAAGDGSSIRLDKDILACSQACSTLELSNNIRTSTQALTSIDSRIVTVLGESIVQVQGEGVFLNCIGTGVPVKGSGSVFVGDANDSLAVRAKSTNSETSPCEYWTKNHHKDYSGPASRFQDSSQTRSEDVAFRLEVNLAVGNITIGSIFKWGTVEQGLDICKEDTARKFQAQVQEWGSRCKMKIIDPSCCESTLPILFRLDWAADDARYMARYRVNLYKTLKRANVSGWDINIGYESDVETTEKTNTLAHEYGHTISLPDEYLYRETHPGTVTYTKPDGTVEIVPLNPSDSSMMYSQHRVFPKRYYYFAAILAQKLLRAKTGRKIVCEVI